MPQFSSLSEGIGENIKNQFKNDKDQEENTLIEKLNISVKRIHKEKRKRKSSSVKANSAKSNARRSKAVIKQANSKRIRDYDHELSKAK